jgi:hypothetical protein
VVSRSRLRNPLPRLAHPPHPCRGHALRTPPGGPRRCGRGHRPPVSRGRRRGRNEFRRCSGLVLSDSRVAGSGAPEKPAGTVSGAGLSPGARPESPQSRSLFGLSKALAAQRKGMRQTSSGSRLPRPGRAGSSLQSRISSGCLDIEGASRNPAEISRETRGRIARRASCGNQSVGGAADRTAIPIARRQTRSRIAPIRISAALRPTQMPGAPHRRGKHRTYATGSPTAQ